MRLGIAMPERHVSKEVLDAALEATTRLDESMIASGAPTFDEAGHKVRWRPEPPGQEHFDHIGRVLPRGWGDCDDLAPWHAASLRHTGEDPGATAEVYKSGPKRWHAIVRRSDGSIDDPSRWRGMGKHAGIVGAVFDPIGDMSGGLVAGVGGFSISPRIAARPLPNGSWEARADLPYNFIPWIRDAPGVTPLETSMAMLHRAPVASQAIAGACVGAARVANEICDPDDFWCVDYLEALAMANEGADWEDIAAIYGEDIADACEQSVGSIFKKIANFGKKVFSSPFAKAIAPIVPGGGAILMAGKGTTSALTTKGNLLKKLKAGGAGTFRGAADYLDNPLVKYGSNIVPGMGQVVKAAHTATDAAASALEAQPAVRRALEHTPTMARDLGVPKLRKSKRKGRKVRSKGRGLKLRREQGIKEVIIRA